MPTFNQLVRKGRQVLATKSTAPALLKSYNSQKKQYSDLNSPQDRKSTRLNSSHPSSSRMPSSA